MLTIWKQFLNTRNSTQGIQTMAAAVALCAALIRMGFTANAATCITEEQGQDSLAELTLLTDSEIENLCKVVRRPGGLMANPNAGDGAPANIPNPGISVSLRAENNLKLACYFLRYKVRTSRGVVATEITLANVRALRNHKEWEAAHEDVDAPEINAKDWPRTMDAIEEYLRGCLGVTKIPLAYVVREAIAVPGEDPAEGYLSRIDELIARAPIQDAAGNNTATYLADRVRVWELMSDLTRDHDCWSYVRPAQRGRDGRRAFLGLKGHYLGVNNVDNMSDRAEKKLMNTTYSGEKRRWTFEKFVKTHIDQHAVLEGLVEHGYSGIDARSKVRHLLAGIRTNALDSVKTRIMSDAGLRSDFDACVNLFQDFIEQKGGSEVKDVTLASVSSTNNGGGGGQTDIKADMSVEDRYYNKAEYSKLTPAQKLGLKKKREKRGHKPKKKEKTTDKTKDKVELSKRTIKALATAMTTLEKEKASGQDTSEDETSDEEDDEKPPAKKKVRFASNRSNKALSRK